KLRFLTGRDPDARSSQVGPSSEPGSETVGAREHARGDQHRQQETRHLASSSLALAAEPRRSPARRTVGASPLIDARLPIGPPDDLTGRSAPLIDAPATHIAGPS